MTKLQSFLNISSQKLQLNLVLKANFPNSLRAGFSFFSSFSFFKIVDAFIKSDSYCCLGISDLQADETKYENLVFRKYFTKKSFTFAWLQLMRLFDVFIKVVSPFINHRTERTVPAGDGLILVTHS